MDEQIAHLIELYKSMPSSAQHDFAFAMTIVSNVLALKN